jgi:hypothetical protein
MIYFLLIWKGKFRYIYWPFGIYITVLWYILWPFGIFVVIWYIFPLLVHRMQVVYFMAIGLFCSPLVFFIAIRYRYIVVIWYIFSLFVCCTKINLATLITI